MSTSAVFAYRKAWKALNTMLEEGKSYSGFERHSAFLHMGNTPEGSPRYADISGASGLDVLDDGRSIGVVDWDFDGKLDFWTTSRTAPRLRLQQNQSLTKNSFVAMKLLGKNANRSAIGARVILAIEGKPRVRSVRAGHGFLAQSSTWIHVGLREGEQIDKVEVHWPDGSNQSEEFVGIAPGQFYNIPQGEGQARPWNPPQGRALPEPAPLPVVSQQARIVMASRLPFPPVTYTALDGQDTPLASDGRPMLLNLWATWCAPCLTEMREWAKDRERLDQAGLQVLALSVDEQESSSAERLNVVQLFLKKLEFPFDAGLAIPAFLETLEVAGRAQIDKFESFPIPSSILLDAQRRMAIIYKGPVSVDQLVKDVALLGASTEQIHTEAAHFTGHWIEGPWPATPTVMIDKFMSFGNPEAAKAYLDAFTVSSDKRANQGLAESYFLVANELRLQRNDEDALKAYGKAADLDPDKVRVRLEMGTLLFRQQRFAESVPHLQAAVRAQPEVANTRKMLSLALIQSKRYAEAVPHLDQLIQADDNDAMAHLWLGHALVRVRKAEKATRHFRASLRLQPDSFIAANELAWLLATHSDAKIRQPKEALALASKAALETRSQNADILDTLAAAHAATGDFQTALTTIDQAIAFAVNSNQRLLEGLQRRRRVYEQNRPYREVAPISD
ncbi:MAG: tetratricopeptide (TPR) repeat protein [Verrucomicrobiales bacterium]|jgi:tetratricopeptide (TPR) repeat protein